MFNSLTGTITGKFPKRILIDTRGIEWDVCVPDTAIDELPPVGQTGRIFTWLSHREDSMDLYGFASEEERALFLDLMKVEGIGAKGAVRILSGVSRGRLMAALESGDLSALEKIQGVGKKTAAKMMLTLKNRLILDGAAAERDGDYGVVITALLDMGYDRGECENTVPALARRLEREGVFAEKSRAEREDILFRKALLEMAK